MPLTQLKISKQITVRENYSIEKYLQQVQFTPLLTVEQEIEYTKLIRQGVEVAEAFKKKKKAVYQKIKDSNKTNDPKKIAEANKAAKALKKEEKRMLLLTKRAKDAKDKLTIGNLRFVISVAKQYQKRGLSICDLINEGNIGLIKASARFDETRGFKFISYAVWWIRQCILQIIQEKAKPVRTPLNQTSLLQKIYKAWRSLINVLERDPNPYEIAEKLQLPVSTIIAVQEANMKPLSIDAPLKQGEDSTLMDILENEEADSPEESLMNASSREELDEMINKLDPRVQQVLRENFGFKNADGFPKSLEDIAKKLKVTRERIRQLREKGLAELRQLFLAKR